MTYEELVKPLKPCPFCGRKMEMRTFVDNEGYCVYILRHAGDERLPCVLNNGLTNKDRHLLTYMWNKRVRAEKGEQDG